MNMLIAIMSDTYSKVMDNQERFGLFQRTKSWFIYLGWFNFSDKFNNMKYLYIIEPIQQNDDKAGAVISQLRKQNIELWDRLSNEREKDHRA